jgi:glycine/D-amino acid oxidase-like deaminating enzyme
LLDAEDPGYGASSRNAGYVGRTLWHKFEPLVRKYGKDPGRELASQAVEAHNYTVNLIEKEQIRCYFNYCSRFIAASTPRHYKKLLKEYEKLRAAGIEMNIEMVPREQQHDEIGSDRYYGGLLLHGSGSLHPGLYHLGLLERAIVSGAEVHGRTKVTNIARNQNGRFSVTTSRGLVRARDVIVARTPVLWLSDNASTSTAPASSSEPRLSKASAKIASQNVRSNSAPVAL